MQVNITGKNEPFSLKDTTQRLLLIPEAKSACYSNCQTSTRFWETLPNKTDNYEQFWIFQNKIQKIVKSSKLKLKENRA